MNHKDFPLASQRRIPYPHPSRNTLFRSLMIVVLKPNLEPAEVEKVIAEVETYTRKTLDLGAVAAIKHESHLPIIIDPSQGCGRADMVLELCKAAVALNADGLLIEVHPNPAEAWSDGQQQVDFNLYAKLVAELKPFVTAAGRPL
jgi:3-deoxy-7-phosphoheptulonate synthase